MYRQGSNTRLFNAQFVEHVLQHFVVADAVIVVLGIKIDLVSSSRVCSG